MRDGLIEATEAGLVLELTRTWGPARPRQRLRKLPATRIRDLLLGRIGGTPDPRGIRLVGARITGQLDLTDVRSILPLQCQNCRFNEPIVLDRAQLSGMSLLGSVLPYLSAEHLSLTHSLDLARVTATGRGPLGVVRLLDAHIAGDLDLASAKLTNKTGPALHADNLRVDGGTSLADLTAVGDGEKGAVRLLGAHITGQLDLAGAKLTNKTGPALHADGLQVDSETFLTDLTAVGDGDDGAVRLLGAHITGQLDLTGTKLTNKTGPALHADNLRVNGNTLARLTAVGDGDDGAVRLLGAHITGQLNLTGTNLTNKTGPALHADRLRVDSETFLTDLTAVGGGEKGVVRLLGAHITGQLNLASAKLINKTGPALAADGLRVDEGASMADLTAVGGGNNGVVRLLGAHITGQLNLARRQADQQDGPGPGRRRPASRRGRFHGRPDGCRGREQWRGAAAGRAHHRPAQPDRRQPDQQDGPGPGRRPTAGRQRRILGQPDDCCPRKVRCGGAGGRAHPWRPGSQWVCGHRRR
ncbi:hypothetical protein ACFQ1I_46535 [Kitasatospora arboriphila]